MKLSSRFDYLASCSDEDKRAEIANDILEDVYRTKVAIEDVAKRLSSDSLPTRRAVAWILEESGRRCGSAAEYVLFGMQDSDSVVRTCCARCLAWLEGRWLVPAMATLLFHLGDDFFVSLAAADTILMRLKREGSDTLRSLAQIDQYLTDKFSVSSSEASRISAILQQDPHESDASRGILDDSQRIALLWTIKATTVVPSLLSALASGIKSKHESVAVLSAERFGAGIDSLCSDALKGSLASRSKPVSVALNNLASTMLQTGGVIKATLQANKNGEEEESQA